MSGWLARFSIKTRLIGLLVLLASMAVGLPMAGLNGMRTSNAVIDRLYNNMLLPIDKLGDINNHMHNARAQLLLALQHEPGSAFEKAHDHPSSMHFDRVDKSVSIIRERLSDYQRIPMSKEQQRLSTELQNKLSDYLDNGVLPTLNAMRQGDYAGGNQILLTRLDPAFMTTYASLRTLIESEASAAELSFQNADKQFERLVAMIGLALVVALSLVTVTALATVPSITKGVRELQVGGQQLADGNLGYRVTYQGRDELGEISSAFNEMASRFHHTFQELAGAVEQLAAAAEQTAQASSQTSDGIRRQQLETDLIATAMNEMSATVQDVAGNAASAARAAQEADQQSESGMRVVHQTIASIDSLASEVEHAATVIHELEADSAGISSVVDVIRSITEQTNLLALNAAIEAAHAGEHGRGFAVVADEVRSLASRTQQSANEIQAMIEKLQSGANRAVAVMESSCSKAQAGKQQVASAGHMLEQISNAVATINDMNAMIASAAEEQSSVAEEISRNVTNVSQIAEKTSEASRQNVATSTQLASLASQLQRLMHMFRL
ncbi:MULTISPECIES: methyl-accepting chemotaxis protein [Pseudomonadales]|jgi:methyl-accepting chemotaxis protein|uniref:Methyl-accepting chemotaxis sensory transducer n=18 Tax=Pseudomonadales TaxID=72274 RepID=A1TYB2_MARN8|nr:MULTISPECIES: methyl-accepting chemotaxis protein [Pseudomonadales]MBU0563224.1 methyl-accepting chemotaxis protein [Gammaproteobacteria bacterium]MBU2391612.1 methyl-accepting chemotaxis protein [Alphaproteobacteria bacterium]BAC41691.1 putative methyl-accepting chemotaxis protein [Pseudomonas resinovorans]ABM17731.1 methyl-accepting chemotaxis sensory transducer [Marinobacter nauticus VT8]ABM21255.1 methyl-accepting chemotaxis sensory transducer [Marinobacter nauticus VT8]